MRAGGPWQSTLGMDLAGATLGLVGLGKIGTRVAAVAKAFGMNVLAWSQNLTEERAAAAGAGLAASLPELLAASDIVSVHLVLCDRTRGLLDAAALAHHARGRVPGRTPPERRSWTRGAAGRRCAHNRIAGAGLDVFDDEPLPADDPFRTIPNVLATPHLGYVTRRNYANYFRGAVEDIRSIPGRHPNPHVVGPGLRPPISTLPQDTDNPGGCVSGRPQPTSCPQAVGKRPNCRWVPLGWKSGAGGESAPHADASAHGVPLPHSEPSERASGRCAGPAWQRIAALARAGQGPEPGRNLRAGLLMALPPRNRRVAR